MGNSEKLSLTPIEKTIVIIIPIIFIMVSYFLPTFFGWLMNVPIIGDVAAVRFIGNFDAWWQVLITMLAGLILGLLLTALIYDDILKLEIFTSKIKIDFKDKQWELQKENIYAVYKEDKQLVIISNDESELLRETTEHKEEELRSIFSSFNYPWFDRDPYKADFLEWQMAQGNLSDLANAILYYRRQALRDDKEDKARTLRDDLRELGIQVKDKDGKQFIRQTKH